VGAASSRDYVIAIKRLFFAAGSRSHDKLKLSNDIAPRFHEVSYMILKYQVLTRGLKLTTDIGDK
jgi:hypothetical protein